MTHFVPRRLLLALAVLALPPAAAGQDAAPEALEGRVTAANFGVVEDFVARNLDRRVRVDVTAAGSATQGLQSDLRADRLIAYRTRGDVELAVLGGFRAIPEGYAVSGTYVVRSGGTHQGITSFALEPATPGPGAGGRVTRLP